MGELTPAPKGYPIKLVRDRTPQIINSSEEPGALFYGVVSLKEATPWLRKKLMEEVAEYLVEPGLDELADVFAVLEGLAVAHGTSIVQLQARAAADARGGFFQGVMMYGHHPEFDGKEEAA